MPARRLQERRSVLPGSSALGNMPRTRSSIACLTLVRVNLGQVAHPLGRPDLPGLPVPHRGTLLVLSSLHAGSLS